MRRYKPYNKPTLYHISELNHDGETFIPRIPEDAYTCDEDIKHKRICVSTSIIGCIRAIDPCMWYPDTKWYVHVPVELDNLYEKEHIYKPSEKDVPDVKVTREKWITKRVKMKCVGIVAGHYYMHPGRDYFRWIEKF